jgi:predicted helicase
LDALARSLKIDKRDKNTALPDGVTAEDIFQYVYSVLHSPGYRARFGEFLKQDFPRIPLPGSVTIFRELAEMGKELVGLHLLHSSFPEKDRPSFVGGAVKIEKASFVDDCVWIDKRQTAGFKGVTEQTWKFCVGGYQVCEKWLKDRKGRTLSKAEIAQYQRIVVSLGETARVMVAIDGKISKHGGWPGAFATKPSAS